jgi:adenylyltransferase/sulfurtransferase
MLSSSARDVCLIGAGGLGSPAALALCASGACASLTIIDPDEVEISNLHRQLLLREADLGRAKVDAAADTLRRRAPEVRVTAVRARLGAENAAELLAGHRVVLEGSDSLATKFLVSDTAVRLGIPVVVGGVVGFDGQVLTVLPGRTACYRCLFEEPPGPQALEEVATCQQAGVLGPACGVIGALQAGEALRLLRGEEPAFAGALLVADLRRDQHRRVPLRRRPGCPACADAGS